jgi:hypothetical protein
MTDAQVALGVLVGTAIKTLQTAAPVLHVTTFSDAEIDSLQADLNSVIPILQSLSRFVAERKVSRIVQRQDRAF